MNDENLFIFAWGSAFFQFKQKIDYLFILSEFKFVCLYFKISLLIFLWQNPRLIFLTSFKATSLTNLIRIRFPNLKKFTVIGFNFRTSPFIESICQIITTIFSMKMKPKLLSKPHLHQKLMIMQVLKQLP